MGIKAAVPDDDVKKEIDLLFKKLSYNLDVLSNTSFVPKPSFETTKIVANVASINLEEKTPYAFSNKQAMAPQELFNPKKAAFEVILGFFRIVLMVIVSRRSHNCREESW